MPKRIYCSVEEKLNLADRIGNGEMKAKISRENGVPEFTLREEDTECKKEPPSLLSQELTSTFLPVEDVGEAYEELIQVEEMPVVKGHGARRRRRPPTFLIAVWNVNQRILQDRPRTNNAAEEFHSVMKLLAGEIHLNISKLIKTLKEGSK
ncbi:Hypothetical predicted protein [Octopus vulgaris]|uniref:Uncharacterized protein n=1 Tax=Octopus vulgaris TaxID=6645 RepID=A0AA36ANF9_OCTVU|nr:Hypothetical predicted protein [Octopus vulgaris]